MEKIPRESTKILALELSTIVYAFIRDLFDRHPSLMRNSYLISPYATLLSLFSVVDVFREEEVYGQEPFWSRQLDSTHLRYFMFL